MNFARVEEVHKAKEMLSQTMYDNKMLKGAINSTRAGENILDHQMSDVRTKSEKLKRTIRVLHHDVQEQERKNSEFR